MVGECLLELSARRFAATERAGSSASVHDGIHGGPVQPRRSVHRRRNRARHSDLLEPIVRVHQRVGSARIRAGHAANGYYGAFVPCDGTTPFAAPASYSGAPALFKGRSAMLFSGGRAEVSGEAQAYDPVEGTYIYRHLAAAIQLRGGRNP